MLSDDPVQRQKDLQRLSTMFPSVGSSQPGFSIDPFSSFKSSGNLQIPYGRPPTLSDDPEQRAKDIERLSRVFGKKEKEDDTTLLGGLKAGAKSIVPGAIETFWSGLETAVGVATPFADIPLEKRLREAAHKRAMKRDPRYADKTLAQVGMGLGQVGTMTGLRLAGPWGRVASTGVGISLNMSDAMRRIADYEQRTGKDVPWYKESMAHIAGAIIGLTEQFGIAAIAPGPANKMMKQFLARTAPSTFRASIAAVGAEGAQEATAQLFQSLTARGLYDPDAMQDILGSMAEDAKVGGIVGGIAKATTDLVLKKYGRHISPEGLELSANEQARRAQRRDWDKIRETVGQIDPSAITSDLREVIKGSTSITQGTADDIFRSLGGQYAALPFGLENLVRENNVDPFTLRRLIREANDRTNGLIEEFMRTAEVSEGAAKVEAEEAASAVQEIMAPRIQKLFGVLDLVERGSTGGGLQDVERYGEFKDRAIDASDDVSRDELFQETTTSDRIGNFMRGLFGGGFGLGAVYRMGEKLGVRSPLGVGGALQTDQDFAFETRQKAPNEQASDDASFSLATLSGFVFGGLDAGQSHQVSEGFLLPLLGDQASEIKQIEAQIDQIDADLIEDTSRRHLTKASYERATGETISDADWLKIAEVTMEQLAGTRSTAHRKQAQLEVAKEKAYSHTLQNNLAVVQEAFGLDNNLRLQAAKRLGMSEEGLSKWLNDISKRVGKAVSDIDSVERKRDDAINEVIGKVASETGRTIEQVRGELDPGIEESINAKYPHQPKEMTATDSIRLANLFVADPKKAEALVGQMLVFKAGADIATWLGDNTRSWEWTSSGIPFTSDAEVDEVRGLFERYETTGPTRSEAILAQRKPGWQNRTMPWGTHKGKLIRDLPKDYINWLFRTDRKGPALSKSLETRLNEEVEVRATEGRMPAPTAVPARRAAQVPLVRERDVVKLLEAKGILLRDAKTIGTVVGSDMGGGVNSLAFQKLLQDMTGAQTWADATDAQKFFMYSRLVQLPASRPHMSGTDKFGNPYARPEEYPMIYLPDFYNATEVEAHYKPILSAMVLGARDLPVARRIPSIRTDLIRDAVRKNLGNNFSNDAFNEAIARLVETRVLNARGMELEISERDPFSRIVQPTLPDPDQDPLEETPESREWHSKSRPELIEQILNSDDEGLRDVDILLEEYNKKQVELGREPITKAEFVDMFAGELASMTGYSELRRLGLTGSLSGAINVETADVDLSTNPLAAIFSSERGRKVAKLLQSKGAIPLPAQDGLLNIRTNFMRQVKKRFDVLSKLVDNTLKDLGLPGDVAVEYVDNLGGIFQSLTDVGIRGEVSLDNRVAMYDAPTNRIIINLAAVDPNNMMSAQEVIRQAAFHEGLHSLIVRDHLDSVELETLSKYVRSGIVSEEVDAVAHEAGLTWFDRSLMQQADTNLNEMDIEEEAMIELIQALSQNKVPEVINAKTRTQKDVNTIGGNLKNFFGSIIGAAQESEIVELVKVFNKIRSGSVGQRGAGYMGVGDEASPGSVRSDRLLKYADPQEVRELKDAINRRNSAWSESAKSAEQAKVDEISDRIVSRRTEIQESAPNTPDVPQTLLNLQERMKMAREEPDGDVPLLGVNTGDTTAYREALDEFLRMRRGQQGYTMPADQKLFFEQQTNLNQEAQALVEKLRKSGVSTPPEGEPTRKVVENSVPEIDRGNRPEDVEEVLNTTTNNLRYQYLDKRQWAVKQTERLLSHQNMAMIDAETSALVAWRNADSAVNWLPGLMTLGPMRYTGTAGFGGRFENVPVYSDELKRKWGGDGRVEGLNKIFAHIPHKMDQELANSYGQAKRILSKRAKYLALADLVQRTPDHLRSMELEARFQRAKQEYENVKSWLRDSKDVVLEPPALQEIVDTVEVGMVLDDNGTIVERGPNGHIVEFWDRYQAFDNEMIKMSHDTGMITAEVRDEWLAEEYMPFYVDTQVGQDFPIGSADEIRQRGRNLVDIALRRSRENKPSGDMMNSIMENTQALMRDALQNTAVLRTARDSMDLNTDTHTEAEEVGVGELRAAVDQHILRVMDGGVAKFYRLNDAQLAMSAMMAGYNPRKQIEEMFGGDTRVGKGIAKGFIGAAGLLREFVTKTPPFILKNIFRDSWQAMVLTGGGPEIFIEAVRNALNSASYDRASGLGLAVGIDFVAEPGEYGNKMREQLKKSQRTAKDALVNPIAAVSMGWDAMGRLAGQSEVATRLAVYDRVLAKTGDKALAQNMALEIMNYGRRGASPRFSTFLATVPFLNGRLQGLDVFARGHMGSQDAPSLARYGLTKAEYDELPVFRKQRAQVLARGMNLALLSVAYWGLLKFFDDDDEYDNMRDDVKADNWLLPITKGAWLKIPIPFEVGLAYKWLPEQIAKYVFEKDYGASDVGADAWRQVRNTLAVGPPQLIAPWWDAIRNKNAYRGDEIVDFYSAQRDPLQQKSAYTSDTAILLAEMANKIPGLRGLEEILGVNVMTSPDKLDYITDNIFGAVGGYGKLITDRVARSGWLPGVERKVVAGTAVDFDWASFVGGEGLANVPVMGDLLIDPKQGGGYQEDFYNLMRELDRVVATLNSIKERDPHEAARYKQENLALLGWEDRLRGIDHRMGIWREERDKLHRRTDMPVSVQRERWNTMLGVRKRLLQNTRNIIVSIKDQPGVLDKLKRRKRV